MELKKYKIAELKEYPGNYNQHPEQQLIELEKSLNDFGQFKNIVVWKNQVIAGNGLVMAAKRKGIEEIHAIDKSDLTEPQAKALLVADNATPALGVPDIGKLEDLLEGIDFDIPGVNDDFLSEMGIDLDIEADENENDPDVIPEDVAPICKAGQLWQLGKHRLLCGDCTDKAQVIRLMGGDIAEILFTSPPYADMRDYGGNDLSIETLKKFITVFYPYAKYQVVNLGIMREDHEILEYWQDYIQEAKLAGYKFLSWNIWDQIFNGGIAKATAFFRIEHEFLFVFGKEYKEINKTIENKTAGDIQDHCSDRQKDGSTIKKQDRVIGKYRKLSTVTNCYPQLARNISSHPAMFPVELPEEYIKAMTDENDIVAEPFGGSGTTIIACEKTNRKCRMMEISPKYCDVIIARWEEYTGEKAELINK